MIMFRYAILAVLVCAQIRADIIEDGLAHVEELSRMVAAQRRRMAEIASASQELAVSRHNAHAEALNKTVGFHTEASLRKAQVLDCRPSVLEEIKWVSEQALHDWRSCLNISIPVGHMIELGINFTTNLELVEAIICGGVKDITQCNETSVFDRFMCVSKAVEKCTDTFMSNSKGVLYWISKFDEVLEDLGTEIAGCLNITNISFFEQLESKFYESCRNSHK